MFQPKLLLAFLLLLALSSVNGRVLTKTKILADRDKRAQQIQHSLRVVQTQIDNHNSGSKVLPEGKLISLQNRVAQYTKEIEGFSTPLSDDEIDDMIKASQEDEL